MKRESMPALTEKSANSDLEIQGLKHEVSYLEQEVAYYKAQVEMYKRMQFGQKRERFEGDASYPAYKVHLD